MKPILQALVLADQVYKDADSGKMVIAGTFSRYVAIENVPPGAVTQLGQRAGSPFAYIRLTDVRGQAELEIRYVFLDENKVLLRFALSVPCENPLESIELKVPLPMLPAPQSGVYALEILCENEMLGAWNVTVEKRQFEPEE